MWHTIWHAVLESVRILPILFLAYVLIEFIEVKTSKTLEKSKLLKGNFAPLVGASAGLIPQCGFSVIATDLYTKRKISVGTLLAMYIATSDEAIPILLSHPNQYINILIILGVKFALALIVGYGCNLFFKYIYQPKPEFIGFKKDVNITTGTINTENKELQHNYFVGEVVVDNNIHQGCCGHHIEEDEHKHTFWDFIYHPTKHCLKIFVFILLVNIVFGLVIHYIGHDTITQFLDSAKFAQPFLTGLVGLIPNCASSVIITNLFVNNGLSLGACISGLIANAGIGLAILVKQNANKKHTITIISSLYVISVLTGLLLTIVL